MVKVLICCGNGMGTSGMMMANVDQIFHELNVEFSEYHDSVGNVKNQINNYDLLISSVQFESILGPEVKSVYYITLKNVVSKKELKEKIEEYLASRQ